MSGCSKTKSRHWLILPVVLALGSFLPQSKAALALGSFATHGTSTNFEAGRTANQSMTLDSGEDLVGRALALNAGATLDHKPDITMPETGTLLTGALPLLPFGACWLRRRMLRLKQTASE